MWESHQALGVGGSDLCFIDPDLHYYLGTFVRSFASNGQPDLPPDPYPASQAVPAAGDSGRHLVWLAWWSADGLGYQLCRISL